MTLPRLAIVSPFVDKQHGTERRVAECITRLCSDFEIHLYSQSARDVPIESVTWRKIPRLPGPHLFGYLWWFAANHVWRWVDAHFRNLHFDLVYSPGINCFNADAITVHVVFAEMRQRLREDLRIRRSPVRSLPRLLHRRIYYALIAALESRIYPRQEIAIGVVSRQVAGELARHYQRTENVEVIYQGLDADVFSPQARLARRCDARAALGLSSGEFVLLLIGNGWHNKGLSCLLESLAKLADLPVRLLVAGGDNRIPFEAMAARLGVSERVVFLPPSPDVMQYYAACDAYVGPSLHDSFALPPSEAMGCGLPVITSRNNGGSEIIMQGENGLLLENASDSTELASLIRQLCEDRTLAQRLGAAAALTARRFSWQRNAEAMRNLFLHAIESGRSNRRVAVPGSALK